MAQEPRGESISRRKPPTGKHTGELVAGCWGEDPVGTSDLDKDPSVQEPKESLRVPGAEGQEERRQNVSMSFMVQNKGLDDSGQRRWGSGRSVCFCF